MKEKRKLILAGGVTAAVLAGVMLAVIFAARYRTGSAGRNLALQKGVAATCDSVEKEELSAAMAVDGDDETLASRWSSENNWEDASHYIQLEFPEEISVSFVVLKWERRNVVSYALEGSLDGENWETLQSFDRAPEEKHQEIVLEEPVKVRYLRLSTYAVSKEESDYSNLYQNVSLYEFEVYADKPAAYQLEAPVIGTGADGGRRLVEPKAPAGFTVTFIGADLEQVIGADGRIYETIQDKDVTVGYRVADNTGREETREVSFTVHVPAGVAPEKALSEQEVEQAEDEERGKNPCPEGVIPSLAEWSGGEGAFALGPGSRILVESGPEGSAGQEPEDDGKASGDEEKDLKVQALREVAALFAEQCGQYACAGVDLSVCEGTLADAAPGDICLGYAETANGLGREGYTCDIDDICVIKAETATGVRWGTVTLMQILAGTGDGTVPRGRIRDYPLYEVRGFGIDVARKAVSLDTLYAMMEVMSWYKMNDLAIHLNDNTILSTSGLTDSVELAMTADSAFRLESDVVNEEGQRLTSGDYAYTKEEMAALIAAAKIQGVTVVPEIDTPAHALSITRLYPAYALGGDGRTVDQIDLGNGEAVALVERIWKEALEGDGAAFGEAEIVNIGMDEYYGDGEQYRQFLVRIKELVQGTGRTVRLWGSLGNIAGTTVPAPENLQMNLWSTVWADPREMYEAGYSLINMQNSHLYIIPGGGYDYLDARELYENWEPNKFYDYNQLERIPAYSPQMLGAAYMIWNDMSGNLDIGISEYDLYERFVEPLPVLAVKLWETPDTSEEQPQQAQLERQRWERLQESLKNKCYLYDGREAAEPSYEIAIRVRLADEPAAESAQGGKPQGQDRTAEGAQGGKPQGQDRTAEGEQSGARQEQILAEGDSVYGTWAFYAVEPETGKVGFAREGRTYTFDYTLPAGEWVELRLKGTAGQVSLWVDGREADTVGSSKPFEEYATFVFPLQRVGRQTSHFDGEARIEVLYSAQESRAD